MCLEAAKKDGHALDKAVVVSSGMKLKKTLKVRSPPSHICGRTTSTTIRGGTEFATHLPRGLAAHVGVRIRVWGLFLHYGPAS